MSQDQKPKPVLVRNKKGGGVRVAAPAQTYSTPERPAGARVQPEGSRLPRIVRVDSPSPTASSSAAEPQPQISAGSISLVAPHSDTPPIAATAEIELTADSTVSTSGDRLTQPEHQESPSPRGRRTDPETLESFIAHCYGRKGQKIALRPKVASKLSSSSKLDDDALLRLLAIAGEDRVLAVPRQILLSVWAVDGLPVLRKAVIEFVLRVMRRHPIFQSPVLAAAVETNGESVSLYAALQSIQSYEPTQQLDVVEETDIEIRHMKSNAVNLLATWMFLVRGIRFEDLASALLQTVWGPAARELEDDNSRLRALTDVSDSAALGWVADRYRTVAADAQEERQRAHEEAVTARHDLTRTWEELVAAQGRIADLTTQLAEARQSAAAQVEALELQRVEERTELTHQLEHLKGRLVERLDGCIEMLRTGLAAIQRESPRVPVMVERAESVLETLTLEKQDLSGG